MLNNRCLELEVISGSNLVIPSHRIPTGLYVSVSTACGRWSTTIKPAKADCSVTWNERLIIQARPLMLPPCFMPIFFRSSKAVHIEIRASFETVMLGRGELVCSVETTLKQLLMRDAQFEIRLPGANSQYSSLLLKTKRVPRLADRVAPGPMQPSDVDTSTDEAHEAYSLYRKSNSHKDLDIALGKYSVSLDRCLEGHPQRAAALSNLANVILHGFIMRMQIDIDRPISLFRSALALHPEGHSDRPLSILYLCKALHQRYLHLHDSADLQEVVKLYLNLLPLCVDGSYLQLRVIEECNALARDPSDESIALRRMVLDLCRTRGHDYGRSLVKLTGDLYARFEHSGNTDDINEAVDLSRKALTECSAGGERSFFLSVLAYNLQLRFKHLRHPDDISKCISLNREILVLQPPGHSAHQKSLNNLVAALKIRHDQYGNAGDLEEVKQLTRATDDLYSGNFGTVIPPSELEWDQLTCTPEHNQTPSRAKNVVIFGNPGSGKSSVINTIARRELAETSCDAIKCTSHYEGHEVDISGESFVLWDTVGLDGEDEAEEDLKSLLRELTSPGSSGVCLLVYCIRNVRLNILGQNYNRVYSEICRKKVPIVVVITGLDNYGTDREKWWSVNGGEFAKCGMDFKDHACVTTFAEKPDDSEADRLRITESRKSLQTLILDNYVEWTGDDRSFNL